MPSRKVAIAHPVVELLRAGVQDDDLVAGAIGLFGAIPDDPPHDGIVGVGAVEVSPKVAAAVLALASA
jgi:hypothetical protein